MKSSLILLFFLVVILLTIFITLHYRIYLYFQDQIIHH